MTKRIAWSRVWKEFPGKIREKAAAAPGHKGLRIGAAATLAVALLLAGLFFSLRNMVLNRMLESRLSSYRLGHPGAVVEVGSAKFSGLAGVSLENVKVRTAPGDFALSLGRCQVQVSLLRLLTGSVRLKHLELRDLHVDLLPVAAPAAPQPAGMAAAARNTAAVPAPDYGARAAGLLNLFFNRLPDSLRIERLTIHTAFADVRQALYVPGLAVRGPAFATNLTVFDQGQKWACLMSGTIERGKKRLELRLRPEGGGTTPNLPFALKQWGLRVAFRSLAVGLQSRGRRNGVLRLDGSLAVSGLALNHERIAGGDVELEYAALAYSLRVGPDYFELAEPTRVAFNRLAFQPTARLSTRPSLRLALRVPETRFAAADLFSSLPAGLFTRLAGLRARGGLAFHLDFAIDIAAPEQVELDIGLHRHGFRIERFGAVDFRAVNAPFTYTAYERDRAVHSLRVGAENPDFLPLNLIPASLQNAVMISEDGAFFSHRGFLLEPFKRSIVANLRAGRFVRGASTITMQLVKNLYLRRHKTMARKLEEILITWLVEENRLVPKARMLEIYLNIIEWGPGVYGVQEAARYYFAKDAAGLTLAEAVFMASIIPRPKRFMVLFGDDQRLRPWLQRYYTDVARKMLARGWISQFDHDSLVANVELKGPARLLLKPIAVPASEPDDWFAVEEPFAP